MTKLLLLFLMVILTEPCFFQSLLLLGYLVRNGSERVVTSAREHLYDLRSIESYHCIGESAALVHCARKCFSLKCFFFVFQKALHLKSFKDFFFPFVDLDYYVNITVHDHQNARCTNPSHGFVRAF